MAFEGTADVDEESVVVNEFATDDEWDRSVHVGMSVLVVESRDRKSDNFYRERSEFVWNESNATRWATCIPTAAALTLVIRHCE